MLMPSLFGEDFFDNFFDDFTRPVRSAAKGHGFANMPQVLPQVQMPSMRTDIQETADGYEFDVELPGYAKEDITAELKDGYLTITAKKETCDKDGEGEEAVILYNTKGPGSVGIVYDEQKKLAVREYHICSVFKTDAKLGNICLISKKNSSQK